MIERKGMVWFVTRSFPPTKGGGPFVRKQQVDYLKSQGYQVTVITLPQTAEVTEPNVIVLKPSFSIRILRYLERLCVLPDYLILWARQVRFFLQARAKAGDIVFLTTGGELGVFAEVAALKKNLPDVKVVLNYHDVLDYGNYDGQRIYNHPHLSVEHFEKKAIMAADAIITQSQVMREQFQKKYPDYADKFDYCYFGYDSIQAISPKLTRDPHKPITIGYIGAMGPLQSPEVLVKAYRCLSPAQQSKIKLLYIGNYKENAAVNESSEIEKISFVSRSELVEIMKERIDVAFVSAININPLRALMSTKFYEYIGLGLPVLCAVPNDCEAGRITVKYKIGWVANFDDIDELKSILISLIDMPERITDAYQELSRHRELFDSRITMQRTVNILSRI